MTRDEFKTIVRKVDSTYPGKQFLTSKEAFDVWYDELKDFDYADVEYAFNEHIKTIEFLPCVANIFFHLRKLQEARAHEKSIIDAFYTNSSNNYPGRGNDETRALFFKKCYETNDPVATAQYMAMVITKNPGEKPLLEFIRETFA